MISLLIHAVLGILTTAWVVRANVHLFRGGWAGFRVTALEAVYYAIAVASVCLGWYFNIRYVQQYGHRASWPNYISLLWKSWAADSASQDYFFANLLIFPLWIVSDGRRQGLKVPWGFFVMSLFTSFGFSMAGYLAFVERQVRYNRARSEQGAQLVQ